MSKEILRHEFENSDEFYRFPIYFLGIPKDSWRIPNGSLRIPSDFPGIPKVNKIISTGF